MEEKGTDEFVAEVLKYVGCRGDTDFETIQRAIGKFNIKGFSSVDTRVLNAICADYHRQWSVYFLDEDTITIRFENAPEIEHTEKHRLDSLPKEAIGVSELQQQLYEYIGAPYVLNSLKSTTEFTVFAVHPKYVTMAETRELNGHCVVHNVELSPKGLIIHYMNTSESRTSLRHLKKTQPELFDHPRNNRYMRKCGKGLPHRNHTKKTTMFETVRKLLGGV